MSDKNREEGSVFRPDFEKMDGLLPVIVQNSEDGRVLMLGFADRIAIEKTMNTGYATFWSRSRKSQWTKGETSGDYLRVEEVLVDCDQDTLVYRVRLLGSGVCHTRDNSGDTRTSCFYRRMKAGDPSQKEPSIKLEYLEGEQ
ncbi:MAG: phosphoribosyl-AMP cyclohydrolase [Spirochaetales bacterium]|nr:phosphoribosyl-AMP cyclohydrolase [Spirochaetales bacterium]MCF7937396.1 phosphoribosyl-AMP cyclohydrolase [Spirochaetales bacterium]